MSIAIEYESLKKAILIANANLNIFETPYRNSIWDYYKQLGNGRLESVEIDNITDTYITYTIQTSFRGEYDPSEQHTIPISACQTWLTIKEYFDDKEQKEKRLKEELERLLEEQRKSLQEENDRETYERLKHKFEEDKGTHKNA